jgi:hypothetical protein
VVADGLTKAVPAAKREPDLRCDHKRSTKEKTVSHHRLDIVKRQALIQNNEICFRLKHYLLCVMIVRKA